jgi:SET domain-containing protein
MKVYSKNSEIQGKGVFANDDIKKGELVGIFKGRIIPDTKGNLAKYGDYLLPVDYRNAILVGNVFKFTNHSCNPSCGVKDGVKIIALKEIPKGEEITIDYDTIEYIWKMKCNCGSPNCRKMTRGYKYLSKKLKEKYSGFIAPFPLKSSKIHV